MVILAIIFVKDRKRVRIEGDRETHSMKKEIETFRKS
jgi:hypothetical protein